MISGIILGAGSSTRFGDGDSKMLALLGEKPLLQYAIDNAAAAELDEIIIVLGHEADRVRAALDLPDGGRVVINHDFAAGQAGSLVAGLESAEPVTDAAVVLLGDQPGIPIAAITRVIAAHEETMMPVVRVRYRGALGHPILFSSGIWEDLLSLAGDNGAQAWIDVNAELTAEIDIDIDPPADIDTPEDYERERSRSAAD